MTEKLTQSPAKYGSCGVCIALACVAVVFMVWSTNSKQQRNECGSSECRDARAYLDSFLDKAIDPCNDFYRHVCRRWQAENLDGATIAERAAQNLIASLHLMFLERARRHSATSQAEALLVNFYEGCWKFVTSVHSIHGRQFMNADESDADVLQLPDTAAALRQVVLLSLHRGISTVLSFNIVRHSDGATALYVSRGKTLAEKLAGSTPSSTLTDFLREALEQAGEIEAGVNRSIIEASIQKLLVFENQTFLNEGNLAMAQTVSALQFAMLIPEADPRLWIQFVNSLLHENFRLSEKSPVMSHRLDLVQAAVNYLAKNHRIGLLYIFLHILAEVGRFYYKSTFSNDAKILCLAASQEVMGHSWFKLFSSLTWSLLSTPSRARDIFYSIRNISAQQLLDYAMEEGDKRNALASLKGITMLVDYEPMRPETPYNDSVLDYLNLADNFSDYFSSLKALEARRRLQEPPYLTELLVGESFLTGEAIYSGIMNTVVLPPAMRQPPLMYSTRVPLEFDMGMIGVLLAKEVFQANLPSPRTGNVWYEENVKRFVQCVQPSLTVHASMSLRQAVELFSWARALRLAYNATLRMYDANRETEDFEEIWTTAQQTFFRRFCLMTCRAVNKGLDARVHCLVPIFNMVEFASLFRCDVSERASLKHCAIFLGYM